MSIWVHVMLCGRPSSAVARVSPSTACFVVVYPVACGRGACAAMEPLLIIRPGAFISSLVSKFSVSELTSWWGLGFEHLEGLACAEERPDEVHVDDVLEGGEGYFVERRARMTHARILITMRAKIICRSVRSTYIEQHIDPSWDTGRCQHLNCPTPAGITHRNA